MNLGSDFNHITGPLGYGFIEASHVEAIEMHDEWLRKKYEARFKQDMNLHLGGLNQLYVEEAEAANELSLLHGITVRDGQLTAAESPIITLAEISEDSGVHLPVTPQGIALSASIELGEPLDFDDSRGSAYQSIFVRLSDDRNHQELVVESNMPDEASFTREEAFKESIKNLAAEVIKGSADGEKENGVVDFEDGMDPRVEATRFYSDFWDVFLDRRRANEVAEGVRISAYVGANMAEVKNHEERLKQYILDQTANLQNQAEFLRYVLAAASDGDLNPKLVERMEAASMAASRPDPKEARVGSLREFGEPCVWGVAQVEVE